MQIRTLILLVPLTSALLYACGDTEEEQGTPAGYEDVAYVGSVTDEALAAFASALEQKAPSDVASQKATLDSPAAGMAIPKSPVPTFTWHIGSTSSRAVPWQDRAGRFVTGQPETASSTPTPTPRWPSLDPAPRTAERSFASPLRELFAPIRSAHAHGTPFTGTATFLVFSVDTDPKLVRVLTSETSYTPEQAAWDKLAAAGKSITLTLVTALFEQNRVLQDGGPFAGSASQFTVTP
jgi:hypothetical protein